MRGRGNKYVELPIFVHQILAPETDFRANLVGKKKDEIVPRIPKFSKNSYNYYFDVGIAVESTFLGHV